MYSKLMGVLRVIRVRSVRCNVKRAGPSPIDRGCPEHLIGVMSVGCFSGYD
jgi:hypothetical protein